MFRRVLLFFFLLYNIGSLFAQADSVVVDTSRHARKEIADFVFLEKLLDHTRITGKRSVLYIAPSMGYDPNSGWELGLVPLLSVSPKNDSLYYYRASKYSGFFSYSTNEWANCKIDFEHYFNVDAFLRSSIQYVHSPRDVYTPEENSSTPVGNYELSYVSAELHYAHLLRDEAFFGIYAYYLLATSDDISLSDDTGIYLEDESEHNFRLAATVDYDSRDNNNFPTQGFLYSGKLGVQYNEYENKYAGYGYFDYRAYISSDRVNIFAVQFIMDYVNNQETPYYMLPKLGGKNRLRGFADNNMHKSTQLIYGQLEYRRMLIWRLGGVLFAGAGKVDAFGENGYYAYSYGAGLRFLASEKDRLNLRVDYGRDAKGGSAVFFTVGEAF